MNLDLSQQIEHSFMMSVALVPVGNIPDAVFQLYCKEICNTVSTVPLSTLTMQRPLREFAWKNVSLLHSKLRFHFIQTDTQQNDSRGTEGIGSTGPSAEWNHFQIY